MSQHDNDIVLYKHGEVFHLYEITLQDLASLVLTLQSEVNEIREHLGLNK